MPLKIKTVASLNRKTWVITPTSLLKKNLAYSFYEDFCCREGISCLLKTSLIKNRYRCSFQKFAIFTGKYLCWSLFLIKWMVFSCEYWEVVKCSFFYRTPLAATCADVLFYIIFSKRRCWIYCIYTLYNCFVMKTKITLICCHSLSLIVIRCYSLSFAAPLVVIRCHSLSLRVSLSLSLSL